MELALRKKITATKETKQKASADRLIEVIDSTITGEVIMDEALKLMKQDKQSVADWIDLLSGLNEHRGLYQ